MTTLTLVLAPSGPLDAVRDAFQDWSGAGLIDRVLWIEPHMITRNDIGALAIENGRLDGTTLERVLGGADLTRVYVAVLVPVLAGQRTVHPEVERYLADYVEATRYDATATYVRAIVTRVGEHASSDALAVDGWHNVVLSPEDSTGPGMGATELRNTTTSPTLGAHTAADLAGLLGLWTDVVAGPLASEDGAVAGIRLTRSYYRHLGAHGLESTLRSRVYDLSAGVPLPAGGLEYFANPTAATRAMSDRLWARHGSVLTTQTHHTSAEPMAPVDSSERISLFGGFLGAALHNDVRPWVARSYRPVSAEAAAMLHSTLVTADPAGHSVLTTGVLHGGMPAGWRDTHAAAASLLAVSGQPGTGTGTEATVTLWRDYSSGGFTLVDAGEREVGLPPIQEGDTLRVVHETNLVLPGDHVAFHGLPERLVAAIGLPAVAPYDALGIRTLDARLQAVDRRAATADPDGVVVRQYFDQWRSYYADTYAGQVGGRIGDAFQRAAEGARQHLSVLRVASGGHVELREAIDTQRSLLRWVQISGGLTVLLMIASLWLGFTGAPAALTGLLVLPLLWFGACYLIFTRGGDGLVDLINARRAAVGTEQAARQHVAAALADVVRIGNAYEQFLVWSSILGSVLESPFGERRGMQPLPETMISDLPLSMRLGAAQTAADQVAVAAVPLRAEVFEPGWLSECWAAIQAATPGRIDNPAHLRAWADILAESGVAPSAGDEQWHRILDALGGRLGDLSDTLLATVVDSRQPGVTVQSDMFLRGLDSLRPMPNDRLSDGILSDSARAARLSRVSRSHVDSSRRGLSRVISLTQLTDPIEPMGFVAYRAPATGGQA